MSEFLRIAILLLEVLMALQCLQIAFKQEIHFDKYTVGVILIDIIIYMFIDLGILPAICSIMLYVFLFLYCYFEFKQTVIKTIIGLLIGFVLVGWIESIVAFVTNFFKNESNWTYILLLSSLFGFIIAYFIKKSVALSKLGRSARFSRGMLGIIILLGVSIAGVLIDYYFNQGLVNIYVISILTFLVIILCILCRLKQARDEIEKKDYELQLQKIYGGTYEKLLTEVRRKQHDFKNQLGVIYSMHLVAKSLDELISMQKEYGNQICYDCKFDAILTCCNNAILAGYLYHRCLSCEQNDICIDYNIHIEQAECCFQLHEIIEVLGILIDNACESFVAEEKINKQVKLNFMEDKKKIIFSVANRSKYINYSEIEKMFVYGYSSKGENRGIGLARVLELVRKYEAEIKVSNILIDEENWLDFTLEIIK